MSPREKTLWKALVSMMRDSNLKYEEMRNDPDKVDLNLPELEKNLKIAAKAVMEIRKVRK